MSDILTQHGRWPTRRGEILMGLSTKARPKNLSDILGLRYWNDAYICATTQVEDNNAVDVVVKLTKFTKSPYLVCEIEFESLLAAHWDFCNAFTGNVQELLGFGAITQIQVAHIRSISAKRRGPASYETEVVVVETFLIDTGDFPEGKRQPEHVAETRQYMAVDRNQLRSEMVFEDTTVKGWHCFKCKADYFTASKTEHSRSLVPHSVDCPVLMAQERIEFLEKAQPELAEVHA